MAGAAFGYLGQRLHQAAPAWLCLLSNQSSAAITTATGHAIMAAVMAGLTVALLRIDQTVTLRTLAGGRTTPLEGS
ncbi:hypothetical protein ABH926_006233 [Catenulispora sp. GP43]